MRFSNTRRGLAAAIDYTAWPLVSYTRAAKEIFGSYPRYVVGISSEGIESYHINYDIVAASKAVLETLCRYRPWCAVLRTITASREFPSIRRRNTPPEP